MESRSLKKIRASTGFEPMTSVLPVRCSTNWAMKPHIGSEVNLLSSCLPWGVKWCEVYENNSYWTAVVDERQLILSQILLWNLGHYFNVFLQLVPVYFIWTGGLGFSTDQIGTVLLCVAAPVLFLQVWLFPKVHTQEKITDSHFWIF